ncbi:MAG: alpha-amylase/4-alpha-glucanotransferase domain-containing protein, partial [Promethearchaeota archaeon]
GQIKKLSEKVKEELNYIVKGAWLSERVWEPNYPSFLSKAGLKYIIVDDNHLRSCGLSEEDTFYSYTTEDSGYMITVFPINEPIRYLAPWKPAYETIKYLEEHGDEKGDRVILFLSDAEKMGVWGTTYELCYEKGHPQEGGVPYIEALFMGIEKSKIIKPITLSEYMEKYNSKGLIYFPTSSYDKMEEWVLPSDMRKRFSSLKELIKADKNNERFPADIKRFLKGGFWRYFLVKYPEINNMHKKMLYVRKRLVDNEEFAKASHDSANYSDQSIRERFNLAWDLIYKSQCNDCYWHGQFGGVYLHFLRHAVYKHLIDAEKILDKLEDRWNLKAKITLKSIDFDFDSHNEICISTDKMGLLVKPNDGATIFELDYKTRSYNLLNTLSRWYEAYHEKGKMALDRWRKSALRDHIIPKTTSLEDFIWEKYEDYGDFCNGEYMYSIEQAEESGDYLDLILTRRGMIDISGLIDKENNKENNTENDFKKVGLSVEKRIKISAEKTELLINYSLYLYDPKTMNRIDVNSEESRQINDLIDKLYLIIDLPFIFSGDQNNFKCIVDNDRETDFFKDEEVLFNKIIFIDGLYDLQYTVEDFDNKSNSESTDEKESKEMAMAYKYQIKCYAHTNSGYKEIYEGMDLSLKYDLLKVLKDEKHIHFKLKLK